MFQKKTSEMSVRPGKRCPHQWQLCKWPTSLLVHTHGLPEKKQLQQSARLVYSICNIHLVQCKYAISWHAALTKYIHPAHYSLRRCSKLVPAETAVQGASQ